MSAASIETPLFDRTARKAHQWSMVALVAAGLILQGIPGALLLTAAGLIMLAGRFWWPADVVRQLVWRVLEPAGILKRDDVREDHQTRRVARVLGGTIWLLAAASLLAGYTIAAWVLTDAKDTRGRSLTFRRQVIVAPRAPDKVHTTDWTARAAARPRRSFRRL